MRWCWLVCDIGKGFSETDESSEPTGLGMTIVRTIAQSELGGSLTLGDNDPGASVHVRVPLFDER